MIVMQFKGKSVYDSERLLRALGREGYAVEFHNQARSAQIEAHLSPGRTCRICGCSEHLACRNQGLMRDETCSWVKEDLCSNPQCMTAARLASNLPRKRARAKR